MDYDFSGAFKRVENELIDGIMRNLSRHRAEEEAYGFTWEQWQALQLKELEAYRKATPAMFAGDFTEINDRIGEVLHTAYNDAGTAEEAKLLKQIQAGKFTPKAEPIEGSFFGLNTGRLEHMVGATRADFARGEWSMLRQANDEYRRIIFDAQIYSATGATYEKAVDMATKDFLKNGIQCITYKNGSRHNIAEYARMAMKTGQKRAYLMGEGDVHDKYGIHTVRVNKRQDACPLCVGWLGKVLVDDVYAGGTAKEAAEANVPLLSEAMAQGFLHPNCKDVYTMYIEGVSTPAEPWTKEEIEQIAEEYNAEQAIRRAEDMQDSYERMAKYSLDPLNKERYQARADAWAARRDSITPIPPKPEPEPKPTPEPEPMPIPEPAPSAFSDDEMEALEWYVSGDGQWINQYLRGRGDFGTLSENEEWLVEHLRAATDRPINDVDTLYRSVDARAIFGNLSSDELYDLQEYIMYGEGAVPKNKVAGIERKLENIKGKTITEKGFLSSTMDKEVAVYWEDFTGAENPIVLELDAKGKTIKGAKIPEALEVADDPQREVLLAPETRYKIKEISLETLEDAETGDSFKYINVKAEIVTDEAAETIAAFTPAATIQEAEAYAARFCDTSQFGALGVSYDGVSLDVANTINETVGGLYDKYDLNAFGGIVAPKGNTKLGKLVSNATAGYSPVRNSFILNRKSMKSMEKIAAELKKEQEIITRFIEHPENFDLSKISRRVAEVLENSKISGRGTVPETLDDVIRHETGHALEKGISKLDNFPLIRQNMMKYAPKVSGYACDSLSEYIAESFCLYEKGGLIEDAELLKAFKMIERK